MSDNLRRYRAICQALKQAYPVAPQGNLARHLTTLAALISGMVGSRSTQLPTIATKVPAGTKPESRVKRFARWLGNDDILEEVYFLPYAAILLSHLAVETLVLVMDGSVVGRGCNALMIHVIYQGRALPLAWRVRQGPKGHFPEALHIALVELISGLIPEGTPVVLLGDGEFDGTGLQQTVQDAGWSYVCRTGTHRTAWWDGETFRLDTEGACRLYAKRFRIETFFSDQKSRGFHLHKSHLSDPQRLSRLLMAACLAYIWMVYLGSVCVKEGWTSIIHRRHRCDLSLFQLGLRLLEQFINEELSIPVAFYIVI